MNQPIYRQAFINLMNTSKHKLRILFVTSDKFPPFRPAARVIFGEELSKRGHTIDWLLQAENNCKTAHSIIFGNGTAYVAATDDGSTRWKRFRKHLFDIVNDLRIFKLAKREEYDIIQVKDKYIGALIALLAAKLYKKHYLFWLAYPHAEASIYEAKEGIARYKYFYIVRGLFFKFLLYRIILPHADHIFVQSEQMKKDIFKEGVALENMTPIPSSLSLGEIPYTSDSKDSSLIQQKDEKRIVYVGTLMRARRLDFIIRVHSRVVEKYPDARLYLVGKGEMPEDKEFLVNTAKELGILDSVVFTGQLPIMKAWEYIGTADVCLSPYFPTPILNSTSPTKLIEYMAMEKAVVGNDHPEQSLVISESGAGICVPWDESAFSNAIGVILDNPYLAYEMGVKGRKYIEENRTDSIMASIIEEQYFRICNLTKHGITAR